MHVESNGSPLLIVLAAAVIAPLAASAVQRIKMPVVVLEVGLGILSGPHGLEWAHMTPLLEGLSTCGLAFLFFLAGFEIDLRAISGRPITLAVMGWFLSLAVALGAGRLLLRTGMVLSDVLVAVALTTTALGTLLPILRDAGEWDTRFGAYALAAGGSESSRSFGRRAADAPYVRLTEPLATQV